MVGGGSTIQIGECPRQPQTAISASSGQDTRTKSFLEWLQRGERGISPALPGSGFGYPCRNHRRRLHVADLS